MRRVAKAVMRLALVSLVAAALCQPVARAQQPSADALAAAKAMTTASQVLAANPAAFRPLALAAIENISEAKALSADVKAAIATAASAATISKLPPSSDKLIAAFATEMTIDDLTTVTAFFNGDVPKRLVEAQSKMKIEPGKPPQPTEELALAAGGMTAFFSSPAGKSYLDAQIKHIAVLQEVHTQWLMQATTALNDAVKDELQRRGVLK